MSKKFQVKEFKDLLNYSYYLIITSNDKEKKEVNNIIINKKKIDFDLNCSGAYIGLINENIIIHISGSSGIISDNSISRIIIEYISNNDYPIPKSVIMAGFCWGNPQLTKEGDTIISNCVYSLNSRIISEKDETFKTKVFQSELDDDYLKTKCINGPLASLEALISKKEYRDNILKQFPTIVGGEMEGFGYIPTLKSKKIPWLIIKGVSDFADELFQRTYQEHAVANSVKYLSELFDEINPRLEDLNSVKLKEKEFKHLINLLRGESIKITREELKTVSLNDYLNDTIGPIVDSKLEEYFYMIDNQGDSIFVRHLCDLILEIIQNSFRHGKSSYFEISFHTKTIVLNDDGQDFEISKIIGEKGGATAWERVDRLFIKEGHIKYSHLKPNIYKFHLENVKDFLRNLRENCSIKINPGTIGENFSRIQTLTYNPKCNSVYLKDKPNRMTSRRYSIIDELRKILKQGLTVYVSAQNEHDAKDYENKLMEYNEKLIILRE